MMRLGTGTVAAALLLGGCTQGAAPGESANLPASVPAAAADAPTPPAPGTPGGLPDDRTPLSEPKGPIDPKSAEGAGQVAQHFAALAEQGRFAEAEKLWDDPGLAAAFTRSLRKGTHFQIGKPGDSEGAAGSIFITVPVVLYGEGFNSKANVILRRVNDVDGSTETQRRWHIERIEQIP